MRMILIMTMIVIMMKRSSDRRRSRRLSRRSRRKPGSSSIESGSEGAGLGSDSALLVLLPGGVDLGHGPRGRADGGAQCGCVEEMNG